MKVIFLGTRGYITPKSAKHRMHTSTMLVHGRRKIVIDCGEDWLGKIGALKPHAIVITHGHPDHSGGLRFGSPCPVYATAKAWKKMNKFLIPMELRKVLQPCKPARIEGITFEPFPVVHSVLAPAVGYRISTGRIALFYVPDVLRILNPARALRVRLYIGDGATLTRPLVRREKLSGRLLGHASIARQLEWCKKAQVTKMIVTHCGSTIVGGNQKYVESKVRRLGQKYGVRVEIAHDGKELFVR